MLAEPFKHHFKLPILVLIHESPPLLLEASMTQCNATFFIQDTLLYLSETLSF